MAKKQEGLIKTFLYYSTSLFAIRGASLLLTPIYFIFLGTKDYGTYSLYLLLKQTAALALNFSGDWSLYSRFAKTSHEDRKAVVTHVFFISIALLVLIEATGIALIMSGLFNSIFFSSPAEAEIFRPYYPLLAVDIITCAFSVASMVRVLEGRARSVMALDFSSFIVVSGLTLSLLKFTHLRAGALITGSFAGAVFGAGWNFLFIKPYLQSKLDLKFSKEVLKTGFYSGTKNIGTYFVRRFDQILLQRLLGLDALGAYSFVYKMYASVDEVQRTFGKAYTPAILRDSEAILTREPVQYSKHVLIRRGTVLASLAIFTFTLFAGNPMVKILSSGRITGVGCILALWCLLPPIQQSFEHYSNFLLMKERYSIFSIVTIITGPLNVFLNYILIRKYGTLGVAMSGVSVIALEAVFYNQLGKRYFGKIFPVVERHGLLVMFGGIIALFGFLPSFGYLKFLAVLLLAWYGSLTLIEWRRYKTLTNPQTSALAITPA